MAEKLYARAVDVIVIGAGLAGLVACEELVRAGAKVTIFEARDRVGGRTLSRELGGQTIDLGAQWMGDKHHRLRELASGLGVPSFPQYASGKKVLIRGDSRRTYAGFLPKIGVLPLIELGLAIARLERMARGVDLEAPLATRDGRELDAQSVAEWLDRRVRSQRARAMLELAIEMIFAAEPRDLSLLYFLLYARSNEGLQRLAEIEGGAQERRFTTGAQSICERLAARVSEAGATLRLSRPVTAIGQDANGVSVDGVRASAVVVAVPPHLAARIDGVPAERAQLGARMQMGSVIKCIASYDRPFWRDGGYSGEALSTTGAISATFDDCNATGDHAALVGFIVGDAAKRMRDVPEEQRKQIVIGEFARMHGPQAATPIAYVDKDWQRDDHAGGCYVGLLGPGVLSAASCGLRASFGRVFFAGTETAVHHVGYLEGAIESGQRVARELCEAGYVKRAR